MIIDCDRCTMRDIACDDCVVMVLLGPPGAARAGFDDEEEAALSALAGSGLVPPLRLDLIDGEDDARARPLRSA
jgi:hypothetical protein